MIMQATSDLEFEILANVEIFYRKRHPTSRLYVEIRTGSEKHDVLSFTDGFHFERGFEVKRDEAGNVKRVQQSEWGRVTVPKRDTNAMELVTICQTIEKEKGYNVIPCVAGYEVDFATPCSN